MISIVWPGDRVPSQAFGPTTLAVEPWWAERGCHWHCGIDVPMDTGTELRAARDGTVSCVNYGLLGIDVGLVTTDWYVHVDSSSVALGQRVARGAVVARSGNKVPAGGVTYGPHLHFEVQVGIFRTLNNPATSRDPVPVLTAAFSDSARALATPSAPKRSEAIVATPDKMNLFVRGTDVALWHKRWNGTAWESWHSLGGVLGSGDLTVLGDGQRIDVFVVGKAPDFNFYHISTDDAGQTFSPFEAIGGIGSGQLAGIGLMPTAASIDLSGIAQAASDARSAALDAKAVASATSAKVDLVKGDTAAIKASTDRNLGRVA